MKDCWSNYIFCFCLTPSQGSPFKKPSQSVEKQLFYFHLGWNKNNNEQHLPILWGIHSPEKKFSSCSTSTVEYYLGGSMIYCCKMIATAPRNNTRSHMIVNFFWKYIFFYSDIWLKGKKTLMSTSRLAFYLTLTHNHLSVSYKHQHCWRWATFTLQEVTSLL